MMVNPDIQYVGDIKHIWQYTDYANNKGGKVKFWKIGYQILNTAIL